jgi:hypothetical protein
MPSQIYHNLPILLQNKNQIIYAGALFEFLLEPDGSISQNSLPGFGEFSQGPACEFIAHPTGGSLCRIAKPLQSFGSSSELASTLLELSLFGPRARSTECRIPISSRGQKTCFVPLLQNATSARAAYFFAGKGVLKQGEITVPLSAPMGAISGSQVSFPNKPITLFLLANASYSSPVELAFSILIKKDGFLVSRVPSGRGKVRSIWLGQAGFQSPREPGEYLLVLSDQFGRSYASSRLLVRNLSVAQLAQSEGAYTYQVMLDGLPLDSALARVRIEGSNDSQLYPVMQGRTTIFAKPARDGHFIFEIGEASVPVEFAAQRPAADIYLFIGLPGLAIAIFIYVALMGRLRAKYSLLVDDLPSSPGCALELDSSSVARIFERTSSSLSLGKSPLSFAEVALGMRRFASPGRGIFISDSNLQDVLGKFCADSVLRGQEGYYWLPVWTLSHPQNEIMLRQLREILLQSGAAAKRHPLGVTAQTSLGQTLFIPHGRGSSIKTALRSLSIKGTTRILVFKDALSLAEFRRSLLGSGEDGAKLSLALRAHLLTALPLGSIGDAL